jgi:hypothetical protein
MLPTFTRITVTVRRDDIIAFLKRFLANQFGHRCVSLDLITKPGSMLMFAITGGQEGLHS